MSRSLRAEAAPADIAAEPLPQPYTYRRHEAVEPDWRRFPGWRDVTEREWCDPQWQRAHCVKGVGELRAVAGPGPGRPG
ncbi:hypothetical protein [Streptomyces sp. NPDC059604]|uniref:hypothetical protein n=1 Tax=Streptomyces sp. NPDC059604 TaxID=3346881 RepID=UPI0036ACF4AD